MSQPATPPPPPSSTEPPPPKLQFRNILVLTMCGVVVVLLLLLISFLMGQAGDPKKDLKPEMQAPNYQTTPQDAPLKTAQWYIRRGREALLRRDIATCRMLVDDLRDMLKQNPSLLTAEGHLELQDLEEDLAVATNQPPK